MRITCEVRASLAGISALPKAHLAHVLLPRCKDMKNSNNNICPKEKWFTCVLNYKLLIYLQSKGNFVAYM